MLNLIGQECLNVNTLFAAALLALDQCPDTQLGAQDHSQHRVSQLGVCLAPRVSLQTSLEHCHKSGLASKAMSGRGMNASLAVQVERLKKSMQKRDTRRNNDRLQRQVGPAACLERPDPTNTAI